MKKAGSLILGLIVFAFVFTSCNENRVYEKHKDLSPNIEWKKDKVVSFEITIEDNTKPYNLSIAFRHAMGFQFKNLTLNVTEVSPSGVETVKAYSLEVVGDDKEYKGDGAGDIWDLEVEVEPGKMFKEKGVYKYTIEHTMPQDPLNFAMEIGMILDNVVYQE